jgi:hypothetical protein
MKRCSGASLQGAVIAGIDAIVGALGCWCWWSADGRGECAIEAVASRISGAGWIARLEQVIVVRGARRQTSLRIDNFRNGVTTCFVVGCGETNCWN